MMNTVVRYLQENVPPKDPTVGPSGVLGAFSYGRGTPVSLIDIDWCHRGREAVA